MDTASSSARRPCRSDSCISLGVRDLETTVYYGLCEAGRDERREGEGGREGGRERGEGERGGKEEGGRDRREGGREGGGGRGTEGGREGREGGRQGGGEIERGREGGRERKGERDRERMEEKGMKNRELLLLLAARTWSLWQTQFCYSQFCHGLHLSSFRWLSCLG